MEPKKMGKHLISKERNIRKGGHLPPQGSFYDKYPKLLYQFYNKAVIRTHINLHFSYLKDYAKL